MSRCTTRKTSAKSTSRRRRVSGPWPGVFVLGALHEDGTERVAVDPARGVVLREGVLRGQGQLRLAARHGDAALGLEAVAARLPGHQELRDAEEALLEPALQRAHRPSPTPSPRTTKSSPAEA